MRKSVFTAAGVLAVVFAAAVFAGSLDQINPPSNAAGRMSTLTDIYNCLNSGTCNAKSSGGFAEPLGAPGITGHTLDEIMTLAKQRATQTAVPKTGQTSCWDTLGNPIACAGTGQDGDNQKGVALPSPRFTHNSNGTVTDNLTGLIWLKDAGCMGSVIWATALTKIGKSTDAANTSLNSGKDFTCSGYTAGTFTDWRLPNKRELSSLTHDGYFNPALTNDAGDAKWGTTGTSSFTNVQSDGYWSATTFAGSPASAWVVGLYDGYVYAGDKSDPYYVWPVRGGQ